MWAAEDRQRRAAPDRRALRVGRSKMPGKHKAVPVTLYDEGQMRRLWPRSALRDDNTKGIGLDQRQDTGLISFGKNRAQIHVLQIPIARRMNIRFNCGIRWTAASPISRARRTAGLPVLNRRSSASVATSIAKLSGRRIA